MIPSCSISNTLPLAPHIAENTGKIYDDRVLKKTAKTHEPETEARKNHWLGRSPLQHSTYFKGTIAYLKIWHNKVLTQEEISNLPLITCVPGYYRSGNLCAICPSGSYSMTANAAICTACPIGKYLTDSATSGRL